MCVAIKGGYGNARHRCHLSVFNHAVMGMLGIDAICRALADMISRRFRNQPKIGWHVHEIKISKCKCFVLKIIEKFRM